MRKLWESFVNSGTFRFSQVINTPSDGNAEAMQNQNLELNHFELRAWLQFNKGLFYMLKDVFLCKQTTCKYMQIDRSLYPHLECKSTSKSTMTKKKKKSSMMCFYSLKRQRRTIHQINLCCGCVCRRCPLSFLPEIAYYRDRPLKADVQKTASKK